MADIVPSLFGLTPGMYQQAQQQRGDEMALQYAKLDPFQQANYAIGRGAYGLAGAAGGLLGGQDPELQRITRRQQIASQVDFTNPKSIQEGITLLGDDIMGKQQLAAIYRQQLESGALVGQREAAALASRAAATTSAAEASDIAAQQKAFAALTGGQVPTAPATPAAAAPTPAMIDQATGAMTYAIPSQTEISGTALPSVTEQARPTVATQPNINQQISELEKRRSQLLSLPKVPAAKAQAEVLGDQIKALREQTKPTDLSRLEDEIAGLRQAGVPENDSKIQNRLSKMEKLAGAAERFGPDAETTAKAEFGKPYRLLSQSEAATVNKIVASGKQTTAAAGAAKFVMPGTKALADIPAFRASVQRTIEPQLKTITATDQALQAINDSLATNNFAAYRAAQVQFARAIAGAGDLSQKELKAAGADPSLLGGTADYLSTLFSSTPTADTQKKIRSTLQAIRTVSQKQASNEVEQQRKIALRSPAYDPEAVKEALMFPELLPSTSLPPTATGSMAEQAAAEIKRRAAARQTSGGR